MNDVFFQKKLIPYGLAGGHWWAEEFLAFFFQRPNFSSQKWYRGRQHYRGPAFRSTKTTTEKREPKKFKISCEIQVWTFYMYLVAVLANWRAGHGPQGALEIEFEGVNETRSKYEDNN